MSEDREMLTQVQNYRKIVLIYEGLNHEIDKLITAKGGTGNMSEDDLARYHQMAYQRDEMYNEMRAIEQQLLNEDSTPIDEDNP